MENNKEVIEGQEVTETPETKTYSQAEVDALLQQETDRRVTAALKKQEQKNSEKIREAQKVANMNAQEQYVYQLEQREKEVAEKERQLALAEMKNEASKVLSEKGLSLSLVDLIVNEDADITNNNIKLLDRAFKASVKAEIEKRIGGNVPKVVSTDPASITKEQFNKMSLSEQNKLYIESPDIYKALTNN